MNNDKDLVGNQELGNNSESEYVSDPQKEYVTDAQGEPQDNNTGNDSNEPKSEEEIKKEKKDKRRNAIKKIVPAVSVDNYRVLILVFALFSVLLSAFRVVVIKESVEFPGFTGENQWYKLATTAYTNTFLYLYAAGAVFAFIIALVSHKVEFGTRKRSNAFVFVSSLAGFCMVGCAGFLVYRMALTTDNVSKIEYWVIIFMLITGAFYAMDSVGFVSEKLKPWFATIVIGFGMTRLMEEFFRLSQQQFWSSNEYHFVSLVALMLFFVNNAKFHISEKAGIWYRFFGLFSALSLLVYSLPEIYITLFEPYYTDTALVFCIVDVTLACYSLTKLLSVKSSKQK